MEQIKNDKLCIEVSAKGAELQSIKNASGEEFLWHGDPKYWGRRSPLLFPIIGGLAEGEYRLHGHTYKMGKHGFLRDAPFTLVAQGAQQLTYAIQESDETLRQYPFPFNLGVTYKLVGSRIDVVWHVENTGREPMFFQIGGHPAFLVPGWKEGKPLHARIRIDNKQPGKLSIGDHGLLVFGHHDIGFGLQPTDPPLFNPSTGVIEATTHTFDQDALIFDECQVHRLELLEVTGEPRVTVDIKSPAVGIWSPAAMDAPFVCIEPWYGICDMDEYAGEFGDKYLMNRLLPGASFMASYHITIRD